jgi:signal transduction histidine kinase/CheY-like chemotaxis protein
MNTKTSEPPVDDTELRDCVRALCAQMPQSIVIGLVVGGLFVYLFANRVATTVLTSWYGALCLTQFLGWIGWLRFRRVQAGTQWDPLRWRRLYTARAWAAATLLGSIAWIFYGQQFGDSSWFTVLVLCGLAAGSITSYAYHPPTMYVYLALLATPLWWQLWHTPVSGVGHTIFAFYMGMVAWLGRSQARTLLGSIRIRHENTALVAQLRDQSIALEQASQAKSQFFAAASHDLRQPLHALSYYASLLKPHGQDAPHVERIEQCIGSLDDLLEGVLDISRLDAGRVNPHVAPVAVDQLLQRLVSLYDGAAAAKGLQLRVHARPLWTLSDPALLERVLANLLNNALRYTDKGCVLLAARRRGGQLRVQVFDTGAGIPAEAQERIFDEFVQLGNAQRDPSKGVGLGLATVRRLSTLLGHPVTVRSVPGRGSCFELRLPCHEQPAAMPVQETQKIKSGQLSGRVLVVDDHELVRESLVQTLTGWGLECDSAVDGAQALALGGKHAYDAVLCDWRLPGGLDGAQVLAALRPSQPGLLLTALVTGETEASLGEVPAGILVLRKPIRPMRLRALLTASLGQPAAVPV